MYIFSILGLQRFKISNKDWPVDSLDQASIGAAASTPTSTAISTPLVVNGTDAVVGNNGCEENIGDIADGANNAQIIAAIGSLTDEVQNGSTTGSRCPPDERITVCQR